MLQKFETFKELQVFLINEGAKKVLIEIFTIEIAHATAKVLVKEIMDPLMLSGVLTKATSIKILHWWNEDKYPIINIFKDSFSYILFRLVKEAIRRKYSKGLEIFDNTFTFDTIEFSMN